MTDEVTEIPRCFSISIQSEVAWRARFTGPHLTSLLDCAAEKEQFFSYGCLTRIRVADDGKGSSLFDLLLIMLFHVVYLWAK